MVNKVTLIGNLGRDPELFHTQSGQPVADARCRICSRRSGRIPKLRRGEGRGHRASAFSELMANGFAPSDGKSSAGDRRQSNDKSGGLPDLKSSGGPWCRAGSFWLRGGCVSCRDMPRFAIRGLVKSRDWRGLEQLITQRSLVQIQPPQPRNVAKPKGPSDSAPLVLFDGL